MRDLRLGNGKVATGLLALLALCAAPASALEFGLETLIYSEIIDGETAYPTSPEVDQIAAGGMVSFFLAAQPPVLTGTVARVTLGPGDDYLGGHQIDASGIGTQSFGVSGTFGSLGLPTGTELVPAVSARFAGPIVVTAGVVIPPETSGLPSFIDLIEFDDALTISEERTLNLPEAVSDALRADTTAAVIRLFVDRQSSTARASVEFVGFGIFEAPPLPLVGLDGVGLELLVQGAQLGSGDPLTIPTADLKVFAVHSELAEFAPLFNVDVGAIAGTPSIAYAAAGSAGIWNTIGLGTTPLTTVTGAASTASATLVTDSALGFGPGSPPDAQALMGDFGVDCAADAWSLSFSGLPNGWYRVIVYAPSAPGASTGVMDLPQGEILVDVPGDDGAALFPGVAYVRTTAMVLNGNLDLSGQGDGTFECAGIAGVQLERQLLFESVPGLSASGAGLLIASLLVAARAVVRRR